MSSYKDEFIALLKKAKAQGYDTPYDEDKIIQDRYGELWFILEGNATHVRVVLFDIPFLESLFEKWEAPRILAKMASMNEVARIHLLLRVARAHDV
jgi:hypothetical protein